MLPPPHRITTTGSDPIPLAHSFSPVVVVAPNGIILSVGSACELFDANIGPIQRRWLWPTGRDSADPAATVATRESAANIKAQIFHSYSSYFANLII
jgi:hypothetical protein